MPAETRTPWLQQTWGKGSGKWSKLENCHQFSCFEPGVTGQEKRECLVPIKFCLLVVEREMSWTRTHYGNQEVTKQTKIVIHFLVLTLSLCTRARGTEKWKQLSHLQGSIGHQTWHRTCAREAEVLFPQTLFRRELWSHGIGPVPLLFSQDFWAVNHVRQHLWQCRSRIPCYSPPAPWILALEHSYFLQPRRTGGLWQARGSSAQNSGATFEDLCREAPERFLIWTEAPVRNWASWVCFEWAVTILTPISETALITCTPIGKLFKCELNFRGSRASLHPRGSCCCQFCAGTHYREVERSVFSEAIGTLWSFLWSYLVTSFGLFHLGHILSKKLFFLWSQEIMFSQWAEIIFPTCTPLTLFHFI